MPRIIKTLFFVMILAPITALAGAADHVVRLHFHIPAGDYEGWGIHLWNGDFKLGRNITWRNPLPPAGSTEFGVYFDIPLQPHGRSFSFILHRGEHKSVPEDLTYFVSKYGYEAWQIHGDPAIYVNPPAVGAAKRSGTAVAASSQASGSDPLKVLEQWKKESERELATMTQKLTELRVQLNVANDKLAEQQQRNEMLASERNSLREQLNQTSQELTALKLRYETLSSSNLGEQLTKAQQALADLEKQHAAASSLLREAEARAQELDREVRDADRRVQWWSLLVLPLAAMALVLIYLGWRHRRVRQALVQHQTQLAASQEHLEQMARAHEKAQAAILVKAGLDELTGLATRASFNQALDLAIHRAKRNKKKFALVFIDLDEFKPINDTLGHDAGDYVLKTVAQRFKHSLRENDSIARLGGDEFVILVEDLTKPEFVTGVVQKLLVVVQEPFIFNGQKLVVSASIGVAIFPDDGKSTSDIMKASDTAMYRAKQQGRNNFQFYSDRDNLHALQRRALIANLRKALEAGQIELVLTPLHATSNPGLTDRFDAAEVVPTWRHPDMGSIVMEQLFRIAEEGDLAEPLSRWILAAVFRQLPQWRSQHPELALILPPIPRSMLNDQFLAELTEAARPHVKEGLFVQVQTSVLMTNLEENVPRLQTLRESGFDLLLSDFGSGAIALDLIQLLKIRAVKIDSGLASNLEDQDNRQLVGGILALANHLGCITLMPNPEAAEVR